MYFRKRPPPGLDPSRTPLSTSARLESESKVSEPNLAEQGAASFVKQPRQVYGPMPLKAGVGARFRVQQFLGINIQALRLQRSPVFCAIFNNQLVGLCQEKLSIWRTAKTHVSSRDIETSKPRQLYGKSTDIRRDAVAGTQYAHQDQVPPQYQGGAPAATTQSHQSYYNADAIVPQQTGHTELPGSPPSHPQHANSYSSYTHAPPTQAQDAGGYYAGQQPMQSPQHTGAVYQSPQSTGQHYSQAPGQAYEMHPQQTQSHQEHYGQAQKPNTYQQPQHPQQAYSAQQGHGAQQGQPGTYTAANAQHNQQQQPPGYEKYRNATPIANLTSASAPVDCPNCRQRAMTHTRFESGGTTK